MNEAREIYDEATYEHLLLGFAKQAVNGLCAAQTGWPPRSEDIVARAFEIAERCVNELAARTRKNDQQN